jgi:hypothetical protein
MATQPILASDVNQNHNGEKKMKTPTRKQVIAKMAEYRRLYHQGKLTQAEIGKLEEIPGWTWDEPSQTPGLRQGVVIPGEDVGNLQPETFVQNEQGGIDVGADYETLSGNK